MKEHFYAGQILVWENENGFSVFISGPMIMDKVTHEMRLALSSELNSTLSIFYEIMDINWRYSTHMEAMVAESLIERGIEADNWIAI